MAMTAGTVTVADSGSETKSGMAEAIYDALLTIPQDPNLGGGAPISDVKGKRAQAALANAIAAALVPYITANAQAKITTSNPALQRDPSSSTNTLAPSSDKFIAIV